MYYRRRRYGSLRRFCPITFSICSANRGGMDSGLRTWANETIRERLEAVEKDLPGPLEEIEIYLRSEGVSLEKGTDPGRLADSSEILERLEKDLQIAGHDLQKVSDVPVGNPKSNEAEAWLFYHLKNVYNLTIAAREA